MLSWPLKTQQRVALQVAKNGGTPADIEQAKEEAKAQVKTAVAAQKGAAVTAETIAKDAAAAAVRVLQKQGGPI